MFLRLRCDLQTDRYPRLLLLIDSLLRRRRIPRVSDRPLSQPKLELQRVLDLLISHPFLFSKPILPWLEADTFVPRRSRSIHAGVNRKIPRDDKEVWVERIVIRSGKQSPISYFKSLYSQKSRMEPPTGATKIIYLEDLMEREEDYIASNLAAKKKNQRQSKGPSSSKGKSKQRTEKKEQPKIRKQRKWGILRRT